MARGIWTSASWELLLATIKPFCTLNFIAQAVYVSFNYLAQIYGFFIIFIPMITVQVIGVQFVYKLYTYVNYITVSLYLVLKIYLI